MTATARTKIILDTDPGMGAPGSDIDDGLAIALAIRSPELEVLGLTIVNGNVGAMVGTDVARQLLDRLGRPDVPVILGASAPLSRDMAYVRALFDAALPAPGEAGRPPGADAPLRAPSEERSAADYLVEEAARYRGEVVVVAIGPMTNLALAIQRDPGFAANVRELVIMAGSATTYAQNVTTVADFNAFVDPEALDVVLRSGARIRMVGLDQTSRVILTRDDAAVLRGAGDDFARWAADCADAWIDYLHVAFPNRPEHESGCFLHDPLVVAAVIDSSLCTWSDAHVEVETTSELARGLVVANRGLALEPCGSINARVAVDTRTDSVRRLFLERVGAAR